MNEAASAAIHIQGPTLRWAEVVHREGHLRVERVGHQAFGTNLMAALRGEDTGAGVLDELEVVVQQELADTEASQLRVVVHPLEAYSFFIPISDDLAERDRMRQVMQQAALVTGTRSPDDLRITPRSVRTATVEGEVVEWIHVLAVPADVDRRIRAMLEGLAVEDPALCVSTEAAAGLIERLDAHERPEADVGEEPDVCAIGQYSSHTEYTLVGGQGWYHAHASEETVPENQAFHAIGFLNRIGVSVEAVARVLVYGTGVASDSFDRYRKVVGSEPELLNPAELGFVNSNDLEGVDGQALVPCLGAALALLHDE